MNEFDLIDFFFKQSALPRKDVIFGIGDDAACVQVFDGYQLVISTDTLVAEVHFRSNWDPYDIACKAVLVNVSDMAAMAAEPVWLSLALTLPQFEQNWLARFAQGLHDSLARFNIALIGGDTTRGPLSLTLTIHGLVPSGQALRRKGACVGDRIIVSGDLGAAALAVAYLDDLHVDENDGQVLMQKLLHPYPRVDLTPILRRYATAAIDISDGLSADLNHICQQSGVGACLTAASIPIHELVKKYCQNHALDFALSGGDDYELCLTVPLQHEQAVCKELNQLGLQSHVIGIIEQEAGLRLLSNEAKLKKLIPRGYSHF